MAFMTPPSRYNKKPQQSGVDLSGSGGSINDFHAAVSKAGGLNDQTLYQIILPPLTGTQSVSGFHRELNLLCSSVTLPQRNPSFLGKQIGTVRKSLVNGFSKTDISMSFVSLRDLKAQKYFGEWQKKIFNPHTHEMGYYKDYVKDITIIQYTKRLDGKKLGRDYKKNTKEKNTEDGQTITTTDTNRNKIFFDKTQQFILIDAFPISIDGEDGQTLSAVTPDDAFSSLNVSFSYKEYKQTFEGINKKRHDEILSENTEVTEAEIEYLIEQDNEKANKEFQRKKAARIAAAKAKKGSVGGPKPNNYGNFGGA